MPLVNGIEFSWVSLKFAFLGNVDVKGVQSINYTATRESDNLYGAGDVPVAIGYGNKTFEGEIKLMQKDVRAIRAAAGAKSLIDIAPFTLTISFANGTGTETSDELQLVRFTQDGMSGEQGAKELPVTIPLAIGMINLGV